MGISIKPENIFGIHNNKYTPGVTFRYSRKPSMLVAGFGEIKFCNSRISSHLPKFIVMAEYINKPSMKIRSLIYSAITID
jgi:hypothetical protein